MLASYSNTILILTMVQSGLFFVFLLTHTKGRLISNKILAAYFLNLLLMLSNDLLFRMNLHLEFPHLAYQGTKFIFLSSPILYFYTKSLTLPAFRFRLSDLLHTLPFVLFAGFLFIVYDLNTAASKLNYLTTPGTLISPELSRALRLAYFAQLFIYIVFSLRLLFEYRARIHNAYSATEGINLSWLRFVLYGFIIIWLFDVSMLFLREVYDDWQKVYGYVAAVSRTYTFTYILIFVYKGLKHPQIFHESGIETNGQKYQGSNLADEDKVKHRDRLLDYMEQAKPYLDPEITLGQISAELGVSSKHLSQVINESLQKNFFDFINGYRIEAAKQLLLDESSRDKTILEILYEVGFNSKSSFNTTFKKLTGTTPSQFRLKNV